MHKNSIAISKYWIRNERACACGDNAPSAIVASKPKTLPYILKTEFMWEVMIESRLIFRKYFTQEYLCSK